MRVREIHHNSIRWTNGNCYDRINGPAIVYETGSKYWYRMGRIHRENGPAVIWQSGEKLWYKHGELHRTDGPAIVGHMGGYEWYVNGTRCMSNTMFKERANLTDADMAEIILKYNNIS